MLPLIRNFFPSLFFFSLVVSSSLAEPSTRWTLLNVAPAEAQADCHLLEMPDGSKVLIDAADAVDAPGAAVAHLQRLGISRLALVIISHFHRDHYGRLLDIIKSGVTIDKVILNVPDKNSADREMPWGCDWKDVQAVLAELRARNIPYVTPKAGDRLFEAKTPAGTVCSIDVLCLYDGKNAPIGPTDVNDTSIIVRVSHGPTRILFTGDLNHALGAYLATSEVDLRADLLKVPHHGTEGVAPNEFFDRVGARAVLIPSPKHLWESARSMRIRNYFMEHKIPVHVSGLQGNVTVTLTNQGFKIETEH
jgi:beta-lactamase superfamily II metal-dependent hydrolase